MSKGAKIFFIAFFLVVIIGFVHMFFFENEAKNANYAGKEKDKSAVYETEELHDDLIAYLDSEVVEG